MYRTVEAVGLSSARVYMLIPFKNRIANKNRKKAVKKMYCKDLIPPSIQIICMHKCKHMCSFWLYCRFIATTQLPALLPL